MKLKDRVAIITGSTSGIGEATARRMAEEGAKVVIVGRRAERGQQIAEDIKQADGEAIYIQTDMLEQDQVVNLVDKTIEAYGQIDILVNNAGTIIERPFLDISRDDWIQFNDLDGYSYVQMMQLVIPYMKKQGKGSIINVTSLAAIQPGPTHALYGYVKAGVTHLSRVVAQEFARDNIRVNSVLSGVVDTPMIADNPNTPKMAAMIPMGRMSTSEEQANVIVFLASDEASYITGSSIVADGGVRGN